MSFINTVKETTAAQDMQEHAPATMTTSLQYLPAHSSVSSARSLVYRMMSAGDLLVDRDLFFKR